MKNHRDAPLGSAGRLRDALQDHFGEIEDSGRSLRGYALYFPVMNRDILKELKAIRRRVDGLIVAFETIEHE